MPVEDLGRVIYETDGPVARIVLNWPEKANAQSSEMVWQVDACLDRAEDDAAVKVVILKGNGKGFCAGHAMGGPDAYPEFVASDEAIGSNWIGSRKLFLWPTLRLFEFPKPMIAQVHGYASAAARTGRCCPTSPSPPTTRTSRCRSCRGSGSRAARR